MNGLIRSMVALCFLAAAAGEADAVSFKAGGTLYNVQTRSLTELHFKKVVRQQFDLSCGAAAVLSSTIHEPSAHLTYTSGMTYSAVEAVIDEPGRGWQARTSTSASLSSSSVASSCRLSVVN